MSEWSGCCDEKRIQGPVIEARKLHRRPWVQMTCGDLQSQMGFEDGIVGYADKQSMRRRKEEGRTGGICIERPAGQGGGSALRRLLKQVGGGGHVGQGPRIAGQLASANTSLVCPQNAVISHEELNGLSGR